MLRDSWATQVKEQTKAAPRKPLSLFYRVFLTFYEGQSRDKGKQAIEVILALQKSLDGYKKVVTDLEATLCQGEEDLDIVDVNIGLREAQAKISQISDTLRCRRAALGVSDKARLSRLKNDTYLRVKMNARALKKRIRDRLRQRKFELETLERSYRHTVNSKLDIRCFYVYLLNCPCSEHKLHTHTESSIKRREPEIRKLANNYNKLCAELSTLIQDGKASRHAIPPQPIDSSGLFKLDVDDDIWQDIGLDDDVGTEGSIPQWLGDDSVQAGIKSLLELDRCWEEEQRLRRECHALQEWAVEEWHCIQDAWKQAGMLINFMK